MTNFTGYKDKSITAVSFLLDETGSMNMMIEDAIGSFNNYVETLKEESADDVEYRFSLKKFSSLNTEVVSKFSQLSDVVKLDRKNYRPGSSTPLIDASVSIIRDTEYWLEEFDREVDNVVVVILTDGKENSSEENTKQDLNSLIEQKKKEGWEFVFLGVDIDAYNEAGKYGISGGTTLDSGADNLRGSVHATAKNTAEYASGEKHNMNYTEEQKEELESS